MNLYLETERLILRVYDWNDFPRLHELLSDSETMQFWPAPFTMEQSSEWLSRNEARYKEGYGRLGVFAKRSDALLGDAGLVLMPINGKPECDLGYIIHAGHWGKGYGTEAAAALLRYGFHQLHLRRICANMPVDHIRSRRVAEKLGMTLEGEFLNVRNRNIPTCLYVKEQVLPGD